MNGLIFDRKVFNLIEQ